jgi:hypothetical protein
MLTPAKKRELNGKLMSVGLVGLDQPRSLVAQLALGIQTHGQFRALLVKVEPQHRQDCYEAFRGHLSFEPKPLDVYIAEARRIAEERQLPRWNNETKMCTEFEVQNVGRTPKETETAQVERLVTDTAKAITFEHVKKHLSLTCRYCTFSEDFPGKEKPQAWADAEAAGWTTVTTHEGQREVCPSCSKLRSR